MEDVSSRHSTLRISPCRRPMTADRKLRTLLRLSRPWTNEHVWMSETCTSVSCCYGNGLFKRKTSAPVACESQAFLHVLLSLLWTWTGETLQETHWPQAEDEDGRGRTEQLLQADHVSLLHHNQKDTSKCPNVQS